MNWIDTWTTIAVLCASIAMVIVALFCIVSFVGAIIYGLKMLIDSRKEKKGEDECNSKK